MSRCTARGVIAVAASLAVAACGDAAVPVVIGYAFQPSGAASVSVARDELRSWPPGSPDIRIVFDSVVTGDPADIEVQRAAMMLEVPDLVGIVGHGGSRGSLAAAPVYNEAGIPQIVPTGTSRLLASVGPWTFPLAPNDSLEGVFIADYVAEALGARTVTIFYLNDEYGVGLRDGVRSGLQAHDVPIVDEVSVDPESDFATVLDASLRRGKPEAIVSAARWVETGSLARLIRTRLPRVRVVAGDGALLPDALLEAAGDAIGIIDVVAFWLVDAPDSVSQAFVERFRRVVGSEPIGTHAMTHDALMLMATAVREVGTDPEAIRQYLLDLGGERPPYPGVTGPITFLPERPARFVMVRLPAGQPLRVAW